MVNTVFTYLNEVIDKAAKELFLSKGYEETAITDIMALAGGAKGMRWLDGQRGY